MPRLLEHERSEAVVMLRAGTGVTDVARQFNCARSTVKRLWERYNVTGIVKDRPHSGQPKITTPRQDANLRRVHSRFRFCSATQSARLTIGIRGRPIHAPTVRRRLRAVALHCRRPKQGYILTDIYKAE
ncbi:uncharacterized protein LOC127869486 [Dreissena polymorpha]|uniref:uncharacterized protein LOC127869486 n=1 Tax=Dreissena polymorpha TaxID=45954 RepID=UPI002264D0F9|nr:uncharacterized protein LOC127869486 [Dreissena polymorpha]